MPSASGVSLTVGPLLQGRCRARRCPGSSSPGSARPRRPADMHTGRAGAAHDVAVDLRGRGSADVDPVRAVAQSSVAADEFPTTDTVWVPSSSTPAPRLATMLLLRDGRVAHVGVDPDADVDRAASLVPTKPMRLLPTSAPVIGPSAPVTSTPMLTGADRVEDDLRVRAAADAHAVVGRAVAVVRALEAPEADQVRVQLVLVAARDVHAVEAVGDHVRLDRGCRR